jgi:hypothetical protein
MHALSATGSLLHSMLDCLFAHVSLARSITTARCATLGRPRHFDLLLLLLLLLRWRCIQLTHVR